MAINLNSCAPSDNSSDDDSSTGDKSTDSEEDSETEDSETEDSETEDGVNEFSYRTCGNDTRVGGFRVDLASDFTGVQGKVMDGVVPQDIPEEAHSIGECKLFRARSLFCDPGCEPNFTCSEDSECIPYPLSSDVGTVSVTGMKIRIDMEPNKPVNFYTNPTELPHPGFEEGADIQLEASGGEYEAFALRGFGIGPIQTDNTSIPIETDKPAVITWEPPIQEGPGRIHISLNVSRHGGTLTWIECDVEDTGSFSIPAPIITEIIEYGLSGYPNIILSRRTMDSTTIEPGCVDLTVVSEMELQVEIPGLISCTEDEHCPDGQTCQIDLTCG
ncbi:MAG: hypothetical protein GY847_36745 [Proteobacteria bacterium]|nr:hypothetical protein [Pseudomonadota bacterium]